PLRYVNPNVTYTVCRSPTSRHDAYGEDFAKTSAKMLRETNGDQIEPEIGSVGFHGLAGPTWGRRAQDGGNENYDKPSGHHIRHLDPRSANNSVIARCSAISSLESASSTLPPTARAPWLRRISTSHAGTPPPPRS